MYAIIENLCLSGFLKPCTYLNLRKIKHLWAAEMLANWEVKLAVDSTVFHLIKKIKRLMDVQYGIQIIFVNKLTKEKLFLVKVS